MGSRPHSSDDTAIDAQVCAWITQSMYGAVDYVAGLVHAVVEWPEIGPAEDLAIVVDLDQARRGNFLAQHAR
jgi:hypothetical protein